MIDGEPWFVAKDVCAALGIVRVDSALRKLDDDEKGTHTVSTLGGAQVVSIVSESGLYGLIFQSRKPSARAFRKWITREVLPSIRQHGGYILSQEHLAEEKLAEVTEAIRVIAGIVRDEELAARTDAFRLMRKAPVSAREHARRYKLYLAKAGK